MKQTTGILFILLSFACGCANIVTPSGGEKDETPPVIDTIFPPNNSLFFNAREIEIHFKEYFQATDIFNQLVISPPLAESPDIKVKGKKLILKFNSSLRDSTTYTINFGESIKDITEGNVLENFTYVFSTGSYIDSLQISGQMADAFTGVNIEKGYAVLYPVTNDSSFLKEKPYYFAKTDKGGNFQIHNIKEGTYNLYGIEDQNFNFFYDLPNERIAFLDSALVIDSTINNIKLNIFSEDKIKQHFLGAKSYRYGQSKISFNKNAEDVSIQYSGEQNDKGFFEKNSTGDSITFWHPDPYLDKHTFTIRYDTTDTIINVAVKSIHKDSSMAQFKNTFKSNAMPVKRGTGQSNLFAGWDLNKTIQISFVNPLESIDTAGILVTEDSTKQQLLPVLTIDSNDRRRVFVMYQWKPSVRYSIHMQSGSMTDIFGLYNDSATFFIETKEIEDYGTIKLNIVNKTNEQIILQFMKNDQSIISERIITDEIAPPITYNYLLPETYLLRAIIDKNKNKKWDTGDYEKKIQPEQVIFYDESLASKANWEIEIEWNITLK
ncbi:MAG: Ig-like domain-containing protein [Chitinophagales bacterium]|nr:Ig-like domain-containing protein [Chitinophagales bacterium]